jgi:hypothetical protein
MECPFCAETIKDEALACKHCSRDLRVVRPVLLEIQTIVAELDKLRNDLARAGARLDRLKHPLRYSATLIALYVIAPSILLVAAHIIVTIVLNVSPLYLRLASLIIPVPFGFAAYPIHRVGFRGSLIMSVLTAILSVTCMLTVTGLNDGVPILPESRGEWREVFEYAASIALAWGSGNILGVVIFHALPHLMSQGGKPNAVAFRLARLLGPHVGEDQLRRRARIIQDLLRTAGPLAGVAVTAIGSIYAGLKGVIGS